MNTTKQTKCHIFSHYKGHVIEGFHVPYEQAGDSPISSVFIDGECIGHVISPQSIISIGRGVIDQREEATAEGV